MDIYPLQPQPQRTDADVTSSGFEAPGKRHDAFATGKACLRDAAQSDREQAHDAAPASIDAFLQSIERRAFVMARYALKNEDDALDAVQDAMLKLCESYSDRPADEWGPLFYRILHNGITDRHRPRGMSRLKRWMGRATGSRNDADPAETSDSLMDAMDSLPSEQPGPQDELMTSQQSSHINMALSQLPAQQREVFLLRRWQGLSVRETAEAMNISEGSVKTHLSRAVSALKERLQEQAS